MSSNVYEYTEAIGGEIYFAPDESDFTKEQRDAFRAANITQGQVEAVKEEMTYEEVCEIMGFDGNPLSEMDSCGYGIYE